MRVVKDRLFDAEPVRRARARDQIVDVLQAEPNVVFAYLHGSFLSADRFHDIDVAVYLNEESSQTRRIIELADRLTMTLGYPVDVRALNASPVSFAFKAMQGDLLISRDEERLGDVLERTGRRYLDIAPILLRATRDAFAS